MRTYFILSRVHRSVLSAIQPAFELAQNLFSSSLFYMQVRVTIRIRTNVRVG